VKDLVYALVAGGLVVLAGATVGSRADDKPTPTNAVKMAARTKKGGKS